MSDITLDIIYIGMRILVFMVYYSQCLSSEIGNLPSKMSLIKS